MSKMFILSGFVLFLLSFSGCISIGGGAHLGEISKPKGGPPPHAPAHGYRAKHSYNYYPSAHVYFDTSRKVYFYLDRDNWRMSVSLPESLKVNLGNHVTIDMDTDKPYVKFVEHKKKYSRGQVKKHKKNKKKKKWL